MRYLYGDSTPSPFTSNLLEFLRDAIDFAVYVLEADQRIVAGKARVDELQRRAQLELDEISALARAVAGTINTTPKGATDSPAAECAARMKAACDGVVSAIVAGVRARLDEQLKQAEAEEAAERDGCLNVLRTLLIPPGPPDSSTIVRLRLRETWDYKAWVEGTSDELGLTWKSELVFPTGRPFEQLVRVEWLQRSLDVNAPELSGWLKKEVKIRTQHLERHAITEVDMEGPKVVVRLRAEPGASVGFDLESDPESGYITATRVCDDLSAGPFELDEDDARKLVELCESVQKSLAEAKTRLVEAKWGDVDFRALPSFARAVERLMAHLSPKVHEIARHSLEPNELVLRWNLSNDRREELFVSKTTLREKYEYLPEEQRKLFEPLGLRAPLSRSIVPTAPSESDEATRRSELPPSHPPPPPAKPIAPLAMPPPPSLKLGPPPRFAAPLGTPADIWDKNKEVAPAASKTPPSATPVKSSAGAGLPTSVAKVQPAAKSAQDAIPELQSHSESVAVALKKIIALAKDRRIDEAYRECTSLFRSAAFAGCGPEDQRQALKLLVVLARTGTTTDATREAHRAARERAQALVQRVGDAADYELMGLCQVALNESAGAAETFRKGLEVEQARNPQSELCVRLTKHVASS